MTMPLIQVGPGGDYTTRYVPRGRRLMAVTGRSADATLDIAAGPGNPLTFERSPAHARTGSAADGVRPGGRHIVDAYESGGRGRGLRGALGRLSRRLPGRRRRHPALHAAVAAWLDVQHRTLRSSRDRLETLRDAVAATLRVDASPRPCFVTVPTMAALAFPPDRPNDHPPNRSTSRDRGTDRRIASGSTSPNPLHTLRPRETRHEPDAQAASHPATDSRSSHHTWLFPNDAGARRRAGHQQGDRLRARGSAHQEGRLAAGAEQGTLFVNL